MYFLSAFASTRGKTIKTILCKKKKDLKKNRTKTNLPLFMLIVTNGNTYMNILLIEFHHAFSVMLYYSLSLFHYLSLLFKQSILSSQSQQFSLYFDESSGLKDL